MSTLDAGNAAKQGVLRVVPDADVKVKALADGGEGTADVLTDALDGSTEQIKVTGPLGENHVATYGISKDRKTAIIEMASSSGLVLVPFEKRNPFHTTTYGVGELIKDAIRKGCRSFILGIGGSATNDGGIGMLQALGFEFLTADGRDVSYGADGLSELASIRDENALPELKECKFRVACDVNNPLTGESGATAIFGPQKGATPKMVIEIDTYMKKYAELTKNKFSDKNIDENIAGAGAAGGLGFALLSYLNAVLEPGIDIVLDVINLEEDARQADLIITGEGQIDKQTAMGKAPVGVAKLAKKYNKMVIAFSGSVTRDAVEVNRHGIDAFFPIIRGVTTLEDAMQNDNAKQNMSDSVEQAVRLILSCR
jgi:glycerate kinase